MSCYLAGAVLSPYFNANFFSLIFVNVLASCLSASVGGSLKTNAEIIEQVIQVVHSSCLSLLLSVLCLSYSPLLIFVHTATHLHQRIIIIMIATTWTRQERVERDEGEVFIIVDVAAAVALEQVTSAQQEPI